VLGIADADTAENNSGSTNCVITPLSCSVEPHTPDLPALHGLHPIRLLLNSRIRAIYGPDTIQAGHFCNYGVNPEYLARFEAAGLRIAGLGEEGELRAAEIDAHPFYVITLFHPQLESENARPSPLVSALIAAATDHAGLPNIST
jgi:CTP synthase (UTP-ammonia lyase)